MRVPANYLDFIKKAKHYCDIIERRKELKTKQFLSEVLVALLDLYRSGLFLTPIKKVKGISCREITHPEWVKLFSSLVKKLGKKTHYSCAFDPTDLEGKEITISNLADDLADIYRDVKNSLISFNKDDIKHKRAALWYFHFNFFTHSSAHISDAIRAIHYFEIDNKNI